MEHPECLLQKGRKVYSPHFILSFNYMFARCPRNDWESGEDYPNFGQIRSDQSFNWSVFSIPLWTRFTDAQEYRDGYGVIGYKVKTIRETHIINPVFENDTFNILHKPLLNNYSHCELAQLKEVTKKQKRDLRMTFKHKCIRPLYPLKDRSKTQLMFDYSRMYLHRFVFWIRIALSTTTQE